MRGFHNGGQVPAYGMEKTQAQLDAEKASDEPRCKHGNHPAFCTHSCFAGTSDEPRETVQCRALCQTQGSDVQTQCGLSEGHEGDHAFHYASAEPREDLPTRAEQMAEYNLRMARYDAARARGELPPRPVRPHTPGFHSFAPIASDEPRCVLRHDANCAQSSDEPPVPMGLYVESGPQADVVRAVLAEVARGAGRPPKPETALNCEIRRAAQHIIEALRLTAGAAT